MDNSEIIGCGHDTSWKNDKIQRLVEGMSSHSRIINTGDDLHKDGDISTDGIVRRINSVCGRTTSAMVPTSAKAIHFSNEKKMFENSHMSIQSVRSITFEQWCKQKEMMQRLKDKLIEDAKLEILEQMVPASQPFLLFS